MAISQEGGDKVERSAVLPDKRLPDIAEIRERGASIARSVSVGDCAFLSHQAVACEADYKRSCDDTGTIMLHSQIGYRDPARTRRAWREIWEKAGDRGARIDRYGICLDWSMGFREADRGRAQRGTGLIFDSAEQFAELTSLAPVAPHFGDFVLGMPAAVENTCAALRSGSTAIGNLGQYFTFRLPGWHDDVGDTEATLKAVALIAAQPTQVLIHSNLDDGFAALFTDLACSLGAVLLEQHIVEDLMGGSISHCYGHSFSEPWKRLVFQLALARVANAPGTMVYGNTVMYDGDGPENYASLASYLAVDAVGQLVRPSGHALNPVPITEAVRIPDIDEVVDAAVFASRVVRDVNATRTLIDVERAKRAAADLVVAANRFRTAVLDGLSRGGIDVENPFELLLSLRRIGARRLEELFGPGELNPAERRGRVPVLQASTIARLEETAQTIVDQIDAAQRDAIRSAGLVLCIATTDVHEYGKILLEETLNRLGIRQIDAGVHADPLDISRLVATESIDAIALSTYNGIALDYIQQLRDALDDAKSECPILIGGRMNQIPRDSASSLPVDVTQDLAQAGVTVCRTMRDVVAPLVELARFR